MHACMHLQSGLHAWGLHTPRRPPACSLHCCMSRAPWVVGVGGVVVTQSHSLS